MDPQVIQVGGLAIALTSFRPGPVPSLSLSRTPASRSFHAGRKGLLSTSPGCYKQKRSAPGQRRRSLTLGGSGRLYRLCLPAGAVKPPFTFQKKPPSGPYIAREGVRVSSAPPKNCRGWARGAMITPVSFLSCLRGAFYSPDRIPYLYTDRPILCQDQNARFLREPRSIRKERRWTPSGSAWGSSAPERTRD